MNKIGKVFIVLTSLIVFIISVFPVQLSQAGLNDSPYIAVSGPSSVGDNFSYPYVFTLENVDPGTAVDWEIHHDYCGNTASELYTGETAVFSQLIEVPEKCAYESTLYIYAVAYVGPDVYYGTQYPVNVILNILDADISGPTFGIVGQPLIYHIVPTIVVCTNNVIANFYDDSDEFIISYETSRYPGQYMYGFTPTIPGHFYIVWVITVTCKDAEGNITDMWGKYLGTSKEYTIDIYNDSQVEKLYLPLIIR